MISPLSIERVRSYLRACEPATLHCWKPTPISSTPPHTPCVPFAKWSRRRSNTGYGCTPGSMQPGKTYLEVLLHPSKSLPPTLKLCCKGHPWVDLWCWTLNSTRYSEYDMDLTLMDIKWLDLTPVVRLSNESSCILDFSSKDLWHLPKSYSAFAYSCPLQTNTFVFPLIHSHHVLLSSNKFSYCYERLGW